MSQVPLFDFEKRETKSSEIDSYNKRKRCEDFDFKDIPASTAIYGIHPYPAMFHFLVVRELIKRFSLDGMNILDPFMGSGVVAGECLINGRNFIGYDINPLAVLISRVRTTPINTESLLKTLENILTNYRNKEPQFVEFHNIHYWFEDKVIEDLSKLRQTLNELEDIHLKNFFNVVFSETVRRVSRTDFNEFKLLRKKSGNNNSDVLKVFQEVSIKNIGLLTSFYTKFPPKKVTLTLQEKNIINDISLEDNSIDLVITSPPYGDSKTTVAYGQFSRLSLRWLGFEEYVDRTSLGAKPKEITNDLPSELLYKILEKIKDKDEKRAKEVFSFYNDLHNSIQIISKKVKSNGNVCFVVGNRKVKGLQLPTDKISADFFENQGFEHIETIVREISSKRMPLENAPTNIKGEKDFTMRYEYIVILKKFI
jgi:DNA modification methylase